MSHLHLLPHCLIIEHQACKASSSQSSQYARPQCDLLLSTLVCTTQGGTAVPLCSTKIGHEAKAAAQCSSGEQTSELVGSALRACPMAEMACVSSSFSACTVPSSRHASTCPGCRCTCNTHTHAAAVCATRLQCTCEISMHVGPILPHLACRWTCVTYA